MVGSIYDTEATTAAPSSRSHHETVDPSDIAEKMLNSSTTPWVTFESRPLFKMLNSQTTIIRLWPLRVTRAKQWASGPGVKYSEEAHATFPGFSDKTNSWARAHPPLPHTHVCMCLIFCQWGRVVKWERGRRLRDDDVFLPVSSEMMRVEMQLCVLSLCLQIKPLVLLRTEQTI